MCQVNAIDSAYMRWVPKKEKLLWQGEVRQPPWEVGWYLALKGRKFLGGWWKDILCIPDQGPRFDRKPSDGNEQCVIFRELGCIPLRGGKGLGFCSFFRTQLYLRRVILKQHSKEPEQCSVWTWENMDGWGGVRCLIVSYGGGRVPKRSGHFSHFLPSHHFSFK